MLNEVNVKGLFNNKNRGFMPDDWDIVNLETVIGNEKTTVDPSKNPDEKYEYYSIPAYQESKKPIIEKGKNIRSQKLVVKKNMVLFGKLNPRVPKIWLVESNSSLSQIASTEFIPLDPFPGVVDSKYLYYLCWSNHVLLKSKELVSGSTPSRQRVDPKSFKKIEIPLPPTSEQRTIAHILSTIQQAIEATEKVINAAQELKKSLMQHLFTYGPVSLEEAENVPLEGIDIRIVPKHWNIKEMGEIANIKGGKRLPKGHSYSDTPSQYPYLRVVDFKNGGINFDNLKYITPGDREIINNYTIASDDIYISIAGTIGLVGSIPDELDGANLTENAAKIVIKNHNDIDKNYLMFFLESPLGQQQINLLSTKTSQPKLALTRIKQIAVALPPLQEQKEISYILKHTTFKLEKEKNKNSILQSLFNSMLHHLMTGKLRVNDLDLELPEVAEQ